MTTILDYSATRIGVLFGGNSPEADGSYLSAQEVSSALDELGAANVLLDIGKDDFLDGLKSIDVAFVACHGWYGEDGKLQGLLELLKIPYTGSGVLASAVGMHKPTFKDVLTAHDIPTPPWRTITTRRSLPEQVTSAIDALGRPLFVKPASGGESIAAGVAGSPRDVHEILSAESSHTPSEYILEPLLPGNTFTVGMVGAGDRLQALSVLEIESLNDFYDCQAKSEDGYAVYHCPARINESDQKVMRDLAVRAFEVCGCRDVGRVDLMYADGVPTVLEVNTVPGYRRAGNLAVTAASAGLSYTDLIDAILRSSLDRMDYVP